MENLKTKNILHTRLKLKKKNQSTSFQNTRTNLFIKKMNQIDY